MKDIVEIKSVQSSDEYDMPIFNQIKTINCKFELAQNTDKDNSSFKKVNSARMFCYETDISVGDIVSYKSNNYKVIQVNTYNYPDGFTTVCEVFLS